MFTQCETPVLGPGSHTGGEDRAQYEGDSPAMMELLILILSLLSLSLSHSLSLQPGCVSPPPGSRTVRLEGATSQAEDCVRVCSVLSSGLSQLGILRSGAFTSCWCVEGEIDTRWGETLLWLCDKHIKTLL